MRMGVIAASVAALATMVFANAAMAQTGQTEVCPSYDGKYQLDGGWLGSPVAGITIGDASDEQVTVTVAAGFTLSQFCYKTGEGGGGTTSLEAPIVGPASFTISKTNTGGGISHITFDTNVTPPPVTDLCLNIEDNQESVPAGMIRDANGNCAAPPVVVVTDLCLNIEGNQESVPAGMNQNGVGACLTPNLVITSTIVTASAPTLEALVTPAALVVAPVAANVGAVLGVSTKVVTKAKAKAKKAKAKKAKVVKAKVVKAKVAKPKVTRIRVLPFTP